MQQSVLNMAMTHCDLASIIPFGATLMKDHTCVDVCLDTSSSTIFLCEGCFRVLRAWGSFTGVLTDRYSVGDLLPLGFSGTFSSRCTHLYAKSSDLSPTSLTKVYLDL